jgi:DME family drug/metabolite transporter
MPALVLASILWGTTGTAASFLPDAVSPIAIGASTMTVGGVLLFLFSARPAIAALRDSRARKWLALGALGVFVYPLAFYSAMDQAGVAIGNVVSLGSGPIFAALLEWLFERHRLSRRWLLCAAIAIAGVALLSTGRMSQSPTGESIPLGVVLGLLAGFAYALYTYASTRALAAEHGGRGVMGGMFGVGAVLLAPVLLATGAPLLDSWQSTAIAGYLAIGPMFLAYLLFGFGLRSIRSSVATTVTLIEPLVATVLAILVVHERLTWTGWIGFSLILVGVTLLVSARRPGKMTGPF